MFSGAATPHHSAHTHRLGAEWQVHPCFNVCGLEAPLGDGASFPTWPPSPLGAPCYEKLAGVLPRRFGHVRYREERPSRRTCSRDRRESRAKTSASLACDSRAWPERTYNETKPHVKNEISLQGTAAGAGALPQSTQRAQRTYLLTSKLIYIRQRTGIPRPVG